MNKEIQEAVICAAITNEADTWQRCARTYARKHVEATFGNSAMAVKKRKEIEQVFDKAIKANSELANMLVGIKLQDTLTDISSIISDLLLKAADNEQKERVLDYLRNFK